MAVTVEEVGGGLWEGVIEDNEDIEVDGLLDIDDDFKTYIAPSSVGKLLHNLSSATPGWLRL